MLRAILALAVALCAPLAASVDAAGERALDPFATLPVRGGPWNRTADRLSPEVPVAWFNLLYDLIQAEKLSPPVASRRIGYAGVTLYEAVVPGMPDHRSLARQLNGLAPLPQPDHRRKYYWPAVANSALARSFRQLFAGASAESMAKIDALEQGFAGRFSRRLPPRVYSGSVDQGRRVADAVIAWAAGDGFATLNNCPFTPPVGDGLWVPTLPLFRPALQPCWGQLRPFVLPSGGACAPPPPPAYSTDPASDFYAEGLEVYNTSTHLTAEQTDIARFWADDPALTGTPPGHWISIVGQIAAQRGLALDAATEAYARVGIAVADGFISCWATKFTYNLLRPITYIQNLFDPAWLPLLATPPFSEYTSGHSVQSGAAATVLTDLLGEASFTDNTHAARGYSPRSFDSFMAAAEEAAISRLYAGIHYRAAIDDGVRQGECIGRTIDHSVRFLKDDEDDDEPRLDRQR
jgi:hypothetical protein